MKFFAKRRETFGKASSVFLALEMVFFTVSPALAIHIPSASEMASDLENRYHMNTGTIQNISENLNVDGNKPNVPQVTIFFTPTDPKPGQKITAKALPMYFSNQTDQLYYTWYIKHKGCDLGKGGAECDADGSGHVTVNDWKVVAAKIIAQNGFDPADIGDANYVAHMYDAGKDTDDDGYKAHFGGNDQVNRPSWCYIFDSQEGKNYELSKNGSAFDCGGGYAPVCVSQVAGNITSGTSTFGPGDTFIEGPGADSYNSVGTPVCSKGGDIAWSGDVSCNTGQVACAPTDNSGPFTSAQLRSSGSVQCNYDETFINNCSHLFASTNESGETGNGSFGVNEERFWGTNPQNPSTADNGTNDEANVVGFGQDTFTWNYRPGDQVGVVVEGVSTILTKHDDSSSMIMYAFSKNKCAVSGKSGYSVNIKGYNVAIPASNMDESDLNGCLEGNLVDPLEGGQAKKLDVHVSSAPDSPVNDETDEQSGDTLIVQADPGNASLSAAQEVFTWKVQVSDIPDSVTGADITVDLQRAGLLSSTKGNGLSSIPIQLNMTKTFLDTLGFGSTDPLYLRVSVKVDENFESGTARSGKSDVIVRISNTTKKIVAYTTNVPNVSTADYRVALADSDPTDSDPLTPICNKFATPSDKLDKIACRVMKNEIIGVKVSPDAANYSNFQWLINGTPLPCSRESISPQCAPGGTQNEYAFFAVAGNPGDSYTIELRATNAQTGKSVSLSRVFNVVDPIVEISSADSVQVWPAYLGEYQTLDGTTYQDYSKKNFQLFTGNTLRFKANFIPSYVGSASTRKWTVDGTDVIESDPAAREISYVPDVPKAVGSAYSVGLAVSVVQPVEKRMALEKIWGITALQSQEFKLSDSVQVVVAATSDIAKASGPKKFLATVSQYLPSSIAFAFRLMLTIALLIFTVGFVFALVPEMSEGENEEVIISKRR